MHTKFGEITQPFIKSTLATKNTSVLTLIVLMRHEERIIRKLSEC